MNGPDGGNTKRIETCSGQNLRAAWFARALHKARPEGGGGGPPSKGGAKSGVGPPSQGRSAWHWVIGKREGRSKRGRRSSTLGKGRGAEEDGEEGIEPNVQVQTRPQCGTKLEEGGDRWGNYWEDHMGASRGNLSTPKAGLHR